MEYVVIKRLLHDGQRYLPGDLAPELMKLDAERLLALGVIERAKGGAESGGQRAERPEGKAAAPAGYEGLSNKEIDAKAKAELGIDTLKLRAKADKLTAIGERKAESEKPKAGKGAAGLPEGIDPKLL